MRVEQRYCKPTFLTNGGHSGKAPVEAADEILHSGSEVLQVPGHAYPDDCSSRAHAEMRDCDCFRTQSVVILIREEGHDVVSDPWK